MDANQFATFMASQQSMMQQLVELTKSKSNALQSIAPNTALVPNFDQFDSTKETYKNYIQRFKNYTEMKAINLNLDYCTKLLLNSIGPKHFNIITALSAPKPPSELKYDELLVMLEEHLAPKKNILVAQHRFLLKYQTESQSIAEFVASLRADINECEFTCTCASPSSIADILLRAQFIRGVRDNGIREQLLQATTSKFDEIVSKALTLEAARVDAKELADKSVHVNNDGSNPNINKISINKKSKLYNKAARPAQHQKFTKINYKDLGIAGLCLRCGRNNHNANDCRIDKAKLKCSGCNKTGHVVKVCISSTLGNHSKPDSRSKYDSSVKSTNQIQNVQSTSYGVYTIIDVYQNNYLETLNSERYYAYINIEGTPIKFEVDSGSGYTFLPRHQFNELNITNQLTPVNIVFRSYTKNTFSPHGKVSVNIQYNGASITDDLYVVPDGCAALIGRTWIRRLNINLHDLDGIASGNTSTDIFKISNEIEWFMTEFAGVFEEKIGCIPNYKISLKLRPNATPAYSKERQIPYALTKRVENELDNLESAGIITKTSNSDWGSPLVVIPKADGGVRLCVDYKVGVNQRLINAHYPIRKIEHIFNSLRNSRYFCRLDLFKAYLHVQVDEQSSIIQTISTHRGTYRMNRLSFGIKTAPADFNRIIDQILRDVPKTESYFDDIIIHGQSLAECKNNLRACLIQLQKFDLHLNRSKCSFFKNTIEFLGHTIEYNKVLKSPSKVAAILEMPRPNCIEDVRRFLGMVTYYSRFILHVSTITTPLRELLHKNAKFKWSGKCQKAFNIIKNEIASDRVLMPYNPELQIQLACDASPTGIAGVLSHLIDGGERPIAFASRSLTTAEQNYSQLDREALAIIYAVQHFHEYLFGRFFKLVTDNQPLARIFHQNSKIPQMTSARLQRYAAFLTGYSYEVVSKRSSENVNADCFSRAPITSKLHIRNSIDEEVHLICAATLNQIHSNKVNFKTIQHETQKDETLLKILHTLHNVRDSESEYTIDSGVVFRGQRVIVPKSLQQSVLEELHHTHIGVTKMKQLARRYVYWMSIDKDIECFVRSCPSCASIKSNPAKVLLHPWEEPEQNWQRIHIDYAGPYQGHHFLVVIDAKSKWAEVGVCKNAPSSSSTKEMLLNIFSRNGFPDVMVSDNATIFKSEEFTTFCQDSGIFQKTIAPGHPATNGLAERNIQTIQNKLAAMSNDPSTIIDKIREIIFKYRATPLKNGKSPSEQYLGRQIRIRLDALKPTKFKKTPTPYIPSRQLSVGERVQARYYSSNKLLWRPGIIIKKLGRLHYIIKLDNGYTFKRHINQLRATGVQNNKPTIIATDNSFHQEVPDQQIIFQEYSPSDTENPSSQNENTPDISTSPTVQDELADDDIPPEQPVRRSNRERRQPGHLQDYVLDLD